MRSNNPFLIYFFLGSIILPCFVLSWLAFRSIQNESIIAEKRSENQIIRFQNNINRTINLASTSLFHKIRKQAIQMFDYPKTATELAQTPPVEKISGLQGLFLFSGNRRIFPFFGDQAQEQALPWIGKVDSTESLILRGEAQNMAFPRYLKQRVLRETKRNFKYPEGVLYNREGIIRQTFRAKDYIQTIRLIQELSKTPKIPGLLSQDISPSLWLLQFKCLIGLHQYANAIEFAQETIETFYRNPGRYNFSTIEFLANEMFNTLLSLEKISTTTRNALWNMKHNLSYHLESSELFRLHQGSIIHLHEFGQADQNGLSFLQKGNLLFFRMTNPFLRGSQRVLGLLDLDTVNQYLLNTVRSRMKSWNKIPFRISEYYGTELMRSTNIDSMTLIDQYPIPASFPRWNITLYSSQSASIHDQSLKKVIFLYALLALSLIILVLGSGIVVRGVSSEKKLITMKSNFLSVVTHELKTPLTSIKMFAEMLQRGRIQRPEKVAQYSGLIGKESKRLEALIEDILNYTRLEQGNKLLRKEKMDLSEAVEKVLQSLEEQAVIANIQIKKDLSPECFILSDGRTLHSMIQNLVSNAIKYTLPGGIVSIQTQLTSDKKVLFEVKDSGIGIPSTEIKNIFKDFYRVGDEMTRSTKGTGLGLAIVKRAVEAHNAQIEVTSKLTVGSTFCVKFKQV